MATVKAKCRMLNNKIGFGKLYIQIIHNRQARKIQTPYTVATNEWDEHKGIMHHRRLQHVSKNWIG